jgi:PAS domain S-box-containing protein
MSPPRTDSPVARWTAASAAAVLDAVPSRVSWCDSAGRMRYANAAVLAEFGRSWDELAGATLDDVLGAERYAEEAHHVAAALAGETRRYDRKVLAADGTRRFEQIQLVPLRFAEGRDGFVAHVIDATARVQAEHETQREREQLALRRARHALATALQGTVFATVGEAIEQLRRAGDDADAVPDTAADHIDDAIAALREAIGTLRRHPRARPAAPRPAPVVGPPTLLELPVPVFDPASDADPTRGLDVTRLECILDHLPAAVTTWDVRDYNIFANRPAARWYGYASGTELRGVHASDLLGARVYAASRPHGERAMTGRPTQFVRVVPGPDGRLRYAQITYRALVVDGETVGALAYVLDVTSRVEAEAELHESREQAAVLGDRERIAEDLHDLVIQRLYATNLVLDNPALPAAERVRTARAGLDRALEELAQCVRDLEGPGEAVDPQAAVEQVLRQAAGTLPAPPVLTWLVGPRVELPADLVHDLLAVVNEAVSNAVRHGRPRQVTVEVDTGGDGLRIRVCDDGVGIGNSGRRSGLANLAARAERRGGRLAVLPRDPSGTVIDWRVPTPAAG